MNIILASILTTASQASQPQCYPSCPEQGLPSPLLRDGLTGLGASRNFSSAILRLDLYVSLSGSSSRAFL